MYLFHNVCPHPDKAITLGSVTTPSYLRFSVKPPTAIFSWTRQTCNSVDEPHRLALILLQ